MALIELKDLHHRYSSSGAESEFAIEGLNLSWEDGAAHALLGPSGCGKTTLLNIVSGLLKPTGGAVLFSGEDVTAQSPRQRRIAQVFQFPVVYDTMNVFDNLAFPLRNSGLSGQNVRKRVEHIAELLDLQNKLKARSTHLSPAEKQKVSLGRGIVREDTQTLLLDEPLTAIDPKQKWELRRKLKEVQRALNITTIYVTHDQQEALTFADRVTVMQDGRVVQTGAPEDLFEAPETPFVGYFIGSPGMNILECALTETNLDCGGFAIPVSSSTRARLSAHSGRLQMGIRPEFIETDASPGDGAAAFAIKSLDDTGAYKIATLGSGAVVIKARIPGGSAAKEGETLWLRFPENRMVFFNDERKIS